MSGGFNWKSSQLRAERCDRLARFAEHLRSDNAIKRAGFAVGVSGRTAQRYVHELGLVAHAGRARDPAHDKGNAMPVYLVTVPGGPQKLVDAPNQASARSHVAKQVLTTKVATGKELFEFAKGGGEMETAGVGAEDVPWNTDETDTCNVAADGTERKVGEPRRPAKAD